MLYMAKLFRVISALVLAAVLSGVCAAPSAADAPEDTGQSFTLTFAHVVSAAHPKGVAATRFAELVEEKSNGRIAINVFPDSQLGSEQEITEMIVLDVVHFNAPLHSTLVFIIPEFELFDLPYLFYSKDQAYAALHGALGERFNEFLAAHNLVGLGYWTGGFKQLTNNVRPIRTVEDLSGLQMRVSQSPMLISLFRAINAGGISIAFAELYSALQTGIVDGQENPLSNIVTRRFYEVQNYVTVSNHGFFVYPFFMSAETYRQLPLSLRQVIHEAAEETALFQWELNAATEQEFLAHLYASGAVSINYFTDEAKHGFRAAVQSIYDEFARSPSGAELLKILSGYIN